MSLWMSWEPLLRFELWGNSRYADAAKFVASVQIERERALWLRRVELQALRDDATFQLLADTALRLASLVERGWCVEGRYDERYRG